MHSIPLLSRAPLARVLLVSLLALAASAVVADDRAGGENVFGPALDGLWKGWIVYEEGEIELDITVEIARDGEGALGGTIDVPSQAMQYYPLSRAELDGDAVTLEFIRDSEKTKDARYLFAGALDESGERIEGMFTGWYDDDGRNHVPFVLERAGEAFAERPEPRRAELHAMSDAGDELKRAFDADADKVRLLVTVSPKCGICLASVRMIERYVLGEIGSDELAVYVVWGPMLGGETRADAEQATVFAPGPRVHHYWTPAHDLAAQLSKPLGLGDELAWDTFHLHPRGVRWGEGEAPKPAVYMHVGRSLPADRRFNGKELADEIRRLLAADAASAPAAAEE